VHEELGRRVVELVGVHGLEQAHLVDHLRKEGQVFGHVGPRLAVLLELRLRTEHFGHALDEGKAFARQEGVGAVLPVEFVQHGLVVEHFQLRGGPGHVQEDHPFGPGREVRQAQARGGTGGRQVGFGLLPYPFAAAAQGPEGQCPDARREVVDKLAPRHVQ
jgi:hypothetical protein